MEGSDGYVRSGTYSHTRRPREERYFYAVPPEEWPREWLMSVVSMMEVVLDMPGTIEMQDIADAIDYGPHQLSPRQAESFKKVSAAFERSMAEQAEKCARGEHRMKNGRCWACGEPALKVVEDT